MGEKTDLKRIDKTKEEANPKNRPVPITNKALR